jgi:dCTP deaminase
LILSDREIKAALDRGEIVIDPRPAETDFTTSAVDLRLGDRLYAFRTPAELQTEQSAGSDISYVIDVRRISIPELVQRFGRELESEPDGTFILQPHRFLLGATRERVELPKASKIAARVEGRSTLARLGLVVHFTAPTIHADFHGNIVLEIYNFGPYPLRVAPGMAFCQLILERLGEEPEGPASTTYLGQRDPRG